MRRLVEANSRVSSKSELLHFPAPGDSERASTETANKSKKERETGIPRENKTEDKAQEEIQSRSERRREWKQNCSWFLLRVPSRTRVCVRAHGA